VAILAHPKGRPHEATDILLDPVQRGDGALDATAALQINDRVIRGGEDIAGRDHIGAFEVNNTVAIGMRCWLMQYVDAFAIEPKFLLAGHERAGGPAGWG